MEIAKELQVVIQRQATEAEKISKDLKIKTQDDFINASASLVKIKQALRYVTNEKNKMTDGLNKSLKNIRAFFKPYETSLEIAKDKVSECLIEYQTKEEEKAKAKIEKVEKKVEEGKIDFEEANEKIESLEVAKTVETKDGGLTFKTIRDIEIEDESQIPDEFFELNIIALRRAVLTQGRVVPGVKIVEKKTTSVR